MDSIGGIGVERCTSSKFLQPYRVAYKQNGELKYWDCIRTHNSVSVLIFNRTSKTFVFVKQFRPAVYMAKHKALWENSPVFNNTPLSQKPTTADSHASHTENSYGPGAVGCTYELCAGIIDKSITVQQVAQEEMLEETGYKVSADSLEFVTTFCSSIGTSGSSHSMFYCEVTDEMHVSAGGGKVEEGENIEVVNLSMEDAMKIVFDTDKVRSSGLCFAVLWFDKFKKGTF